MIGPRKLPPVLGGLVLILIGSSGLTGWMAGVPALTSVRPDFIPIAPNTALSFVLLGGAVCALVLPLRHSLVVARAATVAVLVVATVRLLEYLTHVPAAVDDLLIETGGAHFGLAPVGRMAFPTAMTMILGSMALLVSTLPPRHRVASDIARALSLLVTIVGLVFLTGYAYGAPLLYGTATIPMALPTALGFVVLGGAIALPAILREREERREARRALQSAHDALEQRVAERTDKLARANEDLRGIIVQFFDQTVAAESATARARAAEGRFRNLIEGLGVGVLLVTPAGVEASNSAAARILGVDAEKLRGGASFDGEWRAIRLDGAPVPAGEHPGLIALRTGKPQRAVMLGVQREDRSIIWLELWAEPLLRPEESRPYAVTISFADVTARTALEQQLRQAQKMEGIGQLAGGVAHDFNNMLTAIKSFSELVLEELAPGMPHHTELTEIKAAADRAAVLTRQLLAFSRRQLLQPVVLDLNAAIESASRMLARMVGPGIRFETVFEPDLWLVRVDPSQVEQVLMNLVVNARDAMPEGGTLTIESHNARIDAESARQALDIEAGDYVMLVVKDTGAGMSSDVKARIFEPFFTTKPHGEGTGLGLPMVYGIVTQSGGRVTVESAPGTGAVFRIYLPRAAAEPPAVRASRPAAAPLARGKGTILLVEDDDAVRQVAERILVREGYRVLVASTPSAALEIFQREATEIDLVVTDLMLPEKSGRELGEELRAIRPALRLLYMSGYTDDEVVRRGLLAAGADFISKPFTVDSIARHVRTALDAAGEDGRDPVV